MPPPKKVRKTEEDREKSPDGVIRLTDENLFEPQISEYDGIYSPAIEVSGVSWKANIYYDDYSDLHLYLYAYPEQTKPWAIEVKAEFILLNSDSTKNIVAKKIQTLNHEKFSTFMGETLLSWHDLINHDKGFVQDRSVMVEIRFWILNMKGIKVLPQIDFTDSNDPRHDVILVIDGEKIHVSKGILAIRSPVFNAMFYGDFSEKSKEEIELNDVEKEEFVELLHMIYYPTARKITDDSVEFLLKLGDQFEMQCVIDRAEDFLLLESEKFSNLDKLRIADQYDLFGLQQHCLSFLTTRKDFQKVKDSSIYRNLSGNTKGILFERLLKITA